MLRLSAMALSLLIACTTLACTTIDPGPNPVISDQTFNADYFFCHVEPEFLVAKRCGGGDPSQGDPSGGCHFNSAAVPGMALIDHPQVDCGGGDHPVDRTQVGAGSAAQGDLQAASLEMSRDYLTAPILVRPSGSNHPRAVVAQGDPVIAVIQAWAAAP